MWPLYDFDAHWPEFWAAWSSDEVQTVLERDMKTWCATHAYQEPDGSRPTWTKGEPLWHLSRTDYWHTLHEDEVNEIVAARYDAEFAAFKKRLAEEGRVIDDEDELDELFDEEVGWDRWAAVHNSFKPKPGTLESLVLVGGHNFMAAALEATARKLFPDGQVLTLLDYDNDVKRRVVSHSQNLEFDLITFYLRKAGHAAAP